MYAKGKFKEVFFYKEDVLKHAEKIYQPANKKVAITWKQVIN